MAEITPTQGGPGVIPGPPTSAESKPAKVMRFIRKQSGVVNGGIVELLLGPVPSSCEWEIERISIHTTSTIMSVFEVYEDVVSPANRREYSPVGNDDVADSNSPIWFASGQSVILRWNGLSALDAAGDPTVASFNAQIRQVG